MTLVLRVIISHYGFSFFFTTIVGRRGTHHSTCAFARKLYVYVTLLNVRVAERRVGMRRVSMLQKHCVKECVNERVNEWVNERVNEWVKECVNEWVKECVMRGPCEEEAAAKRRAAELADEIARLTAATERASESAAAALNALKSELASLKH